MSTLSMEKYIRPDSIAIIGATPKKGALGNTTLRNLIEVNFKGEIYCVNPGYIEIEGFPCYPSTKDIPVPVDVGVIVVPSHAVEQAVIDCAARQISYLLIISGGFAEMGEEGAKKQKEILNICRDNNIRVIGPNTMGSFNIKDKIPLSFSPQSSMNWLFGNVGFASQSGATGGVIMNRASEEKIGFSYVYTLGNQIDLTTIDVLESMLNDKETTILASYMEGVPDGQRLKKFAKNALERDKPVIIYKSGRSEAGQKAALSHTASLTGSNIGFQLLANKYGITAVDDMEDLINSMKAFRSKKRFTGKNVATLVISGALGIMIADKLSDYQFEFANLREQTKEKLKEQVPSYLPVENPVDIGATLTTNPLIYKHCIQTLAEAPEVDCVIVHLPLGHKVGGLKFAEDIIDVANKTPKPIFVVTTGTEEAMAPVRYKLTEADVPAYSAVSDAVSCLHKLQRYSIIQQNFQETQFKERQPITFSTDQPSLVEGEVKLLLKKFGVPIPNGFMANSPQDLSKSIHQLNYPVVAKIASPQIMHKSDIGGLVLNIQNDSELVEAYHAILDNVQQHCPEASIQGVLVEEMVQQSGLEIIVGITKDSVFGPIIMVGLGGIYVEVMKDISQRLAPVSPTEAREMIEELKSVAVLKGIRNGISYDIKALSNVLSELSHLPAVLGDNWQDVEINPLMIFEDDKGIIALDGLITLDPNKTKQIVNQ
jgi:acyl-CoA synthetase (NDP forming)